MVTRLWTLNFLIGKFLLNVCELISHFNSVTNATVIVTNVILETFINTLNILDHYFALSQAFCHDYDVIKIKQMLLHEKTNNLGFRPSQT